VQEAKISVDVIRRIERELPCDAEVSYDMVQGKKRSSSCAWSTAGSYSGGASWVDAVIDMVADLARNGVETLVRAPPTSGETE